MECTFGDMLRNIRESQHITRKQLAEDICSERQLQRLEQGESEPTMPILFELSMKLHTDLDAIYQVYMRNEKMEEYEIYLTLDQLVKNCDVKGMRIYLTKVQEKKDNENAYLTEMICYAKALCSYSLDHNCERAEHYIDKAMKYERITSIARFTGNEMLSELGYCLVNLKANIMGQRDKEQDRVSLLRKLLHSIEINYMVKGWNSFLANKFIDKFYVVLLLNTGTAQYQMGELEDALTLVNEGIQYSFHNNIGSSLASLYDMKARIMYKQGFEKTAAGLFQTAFIMYQDQGVTGYLKEYQKMIRENFPMVKIPILFFPVQN